MVGEPILSDIHLARCDRTIENRLQDLGSVKVFRYVNDCLVFQNTGEARDTPFLVDLFRGVLKLDLKSESRGPAWVPGA